jgi:hypothetical protein
MLFDKQILGALSMAITLGGMIYYISYIFHGRFKPHFFSWLVWTAVTAIVFAGLVAEHSGPAAWRTGLMTVMCLVIALLSLRNGFGYIKKIDFYTLLSSLAAIPIWLVNKDPSWAIIWLLAVEGAATLPAIRKAWHLPWEDSLVACSCSTASNILSIFALTSASAAPAIYYAGWSVILMSYFCVIVWRRRALPKPASISSPGT